ncbi:2-octaprenyl-3-methyl-6-methoxy-1,4-benzoquinol hydroxylase [Morganella morganii]|uniref:FAD-dependent 2-octaprenylphenol hydroxylase n=1 Tax=Morganella morganii TaxID=582 RepID=UPI000DA2B676|nr:FAD-dependent 2-octaprenylphenol hydroxylase [Morganella morganii]SQL18323.1 2-octaprenyl-3-methyl-6-methoxy-1,4-benzoquinol hydroxylase [Morganella morganii]
MQSYDVVIAGGGMVGLALACGLHGCGLRIAVIEKQAPDTRFDPQAPFAVRVSAINSASERLLGRLGVWQDILAKRAAPYQGMEVWDNDSFGRIAFSAAEAHCEHLGHIIENDVIRNALWERVQKLSDVTLLTGTQIRQVVWGENDAFITLENDDMLTTRSVAGADGANSWLRQHADIPVSFWDYEHHALVATIRTELPHENVARQVFHGDGILAFLPLPDAHHCSIVWSLPGLTAQHCLDLDDAAFNHKLAAAFDLRLGLCEVVSERRAIPLTGRYARQFAAPRLALLGDAAHTIHPLAGQGVNLGFMDVAELIGEIRRLTAEGKDIGNYFWLRRFERRRKQSAAMMLAGMQGFRELFDGSNPVKKLVRDVGLVLADTLPGVKPALLRHARGLSDMPDWLREPKPASAEKI